MNPRPKQIGGTLIRRVIKSFRENGENLPIGKIAIACSGGADSLALTHLLCKYGKRVSPSEDILIFHINHGWRGLESDQDESFVRSYSEKHGIKFRSFKLTPPTDSELKNQSIQLARDIEETKQALSKSQVDLAAISTQNTELQNSILELKSQVQILTKYATTTLTCVKKTTIKKVTGINPVCPAGYKKK